MTRSLIPALFCVALAAHGQDDQADLSYMLGYDVGARLGEMEVELDYQRFMEALKDAAEGRENALDPERLTQVRADFNQQQQAVMTRRQEAMREELAAAAEENARAGEAFLAENMQREGVITTESGLQYEVVEMGDGPRPSAEDTVRVHYTGTLIDGSKFDSSVDRGEPAVFQLNRVISGWTEGVQLMPVGSRFRFFVPANLAYGGRSMGQTIGPNSTLIFDVELLGIENS